MAKGGDPGVRQRACDDAGRQFPERVHVRYRGTEYLFPGNRAGMFARCTHGRGGWARSFVEARAQKGPEGPRLLTFWVYHRRTPRNLRLTRGRRTGPPHTCHRDAVPGECRYACPHHRARMEVLPSCRSRGGLDFPGRWGPGNRGGGGGVRNPEPLVASPGNRFRFAGTASQLSF